VSNPKSPGVLPRFHITGMAANTAMPSAIIAGPHDQARVCGPITTARTNATTRKMDETAGMAGINPENLKS
jgi:hypothetical protein